MLATILTDFKDALMSGMAGLSRPPQLQAGGMWIDTTAGIPPTYYWAFKLWTGTVDIEIFRINMNSNYGGALTSEALFEVKQVSADVNGAILELIKNRFVDNGQVDTGDTVAEVRMVGRTNTSTDPVVGYIKWVATDDMVPAAFGGTLSFFSTPDATSAITEHLKAIAGVLETTVPHKLNSERMVTQNVATAATIVQLSAAKVGVEFTGSTATQVQGINSGHDSQVVVLHNRSSAIVTLLHQNLTAAAADRLKLPGGSDFTISPDGTATLYYCTTDGKWKMQDSVSSTVSRTIEKFSGLINTWTAPATITRISLFGKKYSPSSNSLIAMIYLDRFGKAFSWGFNAQGGLGVGDQVARSSPTALSAGINILKMGNISSNKVLPAGSFAILANGKVYSWGFSVNGYLANGDGSGTAYTVPLPILGGISFASVLNANESGNTYIVYGITPGGYAYAWGSNDSGQLGVGDVVKRSSPVAVLGGLRFEKIIHENGAVMALSSTGAAYFWGGNAGDMGVADAINRSSPVAVLGGLTFKKIAFSSGSGGKFTVALSPSGVAYAWGNNDYGQLGVGDTTLRSSPVAVLGGLIFADIQVGQDNAYGLTVDGILYAWGRNEFGELGVGNVVSRSSPVAVLGGFVFTKFHASQRDNYAITADGTAYSWGDNPNGGLGHGDTVDKSSPVAVIGGIKFTEIYAGFRSTFGISNQGLLYAWGDNGQGQLGVETITDELSPVLVHGPHSFNSNRRNESIGITVVPGNTYDIYLTEHGQCYFGNTPLGVGLEEITLEYEKRGT